MEKKFKVPQSVKNVAKKALEIRQSYPPSKRGGTSVGVARAVQLRDNDYVDLETVREMFSFFSRHEVDKQSKSWKEARAKGEKSKGEIAWMLWGSDSGYAWAKKIADANRD